MNKLYLRLALSACFTLLPISSIQVAFADSIKSSVKYDRYGRMIESIPLVDGKIKTTNVAKDDKQTFSHKYSEVTTSTTEVIRTGLFFTKSTWSDPTGKCLDRVIETELYSSSEETTESAPGALKWYTKSVKGFNGALTTYKYHRNTDGSIVIHQASGVANTNGDEVKSGILTITKTNAYGYTILTETQDILTGAVLSRSSADLTKLTSWGQPKCFIALNGLKSEIEINEESRFVTSSKDFLNNTTLYNDFNIRGTPRNISRAGVIKQYNTDNLLNITCETKGSDLATQNDSHISDRLGRNIENTSNIEGYPKASYRQKLDDYLGSSTTSQFGQTVSHKIDDQGEFDHTGGNTLPEIFGEDGNVTGRVPNDSEMSYQEGYFINARNKASSGNPNKITTKTDALGRIRIVESPGADGGILITRYTYLYQGDGKVVVKVSNEKEGVTTPFSNNLTISEPFKDTNGERCSEIRSGIDMNNNNELVANQDRFTSNITKITKSSLLNAAVITSRNETLADSDTNTVNYTETVSTPIKEVSSSKIDDKEVYNSETVIDLNGEEKITTLTDYGKKQICTTSDVNGKSITELDHNWLPIKNTTTAVGSPKQESTLTRRVDGSVKDTQTLVGNGDTPSTFSASYNHIGFPEGNIVTPFTSTEVKNFNFDSDGNFSATYNDGTGDQTFGKSSSGMNPSRLGANMIDRKCTYQFTDAGITKTIAPSEANGKPTKIALNAAGLPTGKEYAPGTSDATSIKNQYHPHFGLFCHTAARGGNTLYEYTPAPLNEVSAVSFPNYHENGGDINGISVYSPALRHQYAYRLSDGKLDFLSDLAGYRKLSYLKNRQVEEEYVAKPAEADKQNAALSSTGLEGIKIKRNYDNIGRYTGCELTLKGNSLQTVTISHEGNSDQVKTISNSFADNASFAYDANQQQLASIVRGELTQHYERDVNGRMTSANARLGNLISPISRHDYNSFDSRNRRSHVATEGGSWRYKYDTNGNLIEAHHPDFGEFDYSWDGMGRRLSSSAHPSYTHNNNLNQPTSSYSTQRYLSLWIDSDPDAQLSVNGFGIVNAGFKKYNLPIAGESNEGTYIPYAVTGTLAGEGEEKAHEDAVAVVEGFAYIPPNLHTIEYDVEGNRLADSRWHYTFDARNRLIQLTTPGYDGEVDVPGIKLHFFYDSQGRRFKKISCQKFQDKNNKWQENITTTWFVYDNWALLYERQEAGFAEQIGDTVNHPVLKERFYTWGVDTDGSMGGLGHVGGLLSYTEKTNNAQETYYPTYDGNGNVTKLVRKSDRKIVADYVYGPFGEFIRAKGEKALDNPWRWATKYQDTESGFIYFGHRYFDTSTGSWLSREPLGEEESMNLYAYCHNDPINCVDYLGLSSQKIVVLSPKELTDLGYPKTDINLINGDGFYHWRPEKIKMAKRYSAKSKHAEWEKYYNNHTITSGDLLDTFMANNTVRDGGGKVLYPSDLSTPVESVHSFQDPFYANRTYEVQKFEYFDKGATSPKLRLWVVPHRVRIDDKEALYFTVSDTQEEAVAAINESRSSRMKIENQQGALSVIEAGKGGIFARFNAMANFQMKNGNFNGRVHMRPGVKQNKEPLLPAVNNPQYAATQLLKNGRLSLGYLRSFIPKGTANTFKPSDTIAAGLKYKFTINGTKVEVKMHSPDLNAAQRFPGSNSGSQWTGQIKIGNKLLGSDGKFYRRPSNDTHIPLIE